MLTLSVKRAGELAILSKCLEEAHGRMEASVIRDSTIDSQSLLVIRCDIVEASANAVLDIPFARLFFLFLS
jgi:hypothetical protein